MSRQKSLSVRKRILTIARRVFADKGYKDATVRDIARLAGISIGGLYPYFGNKEQLYIEALSEGAKLYTEEIRALADENPEIAIRRYIEHHLEYTASRKKIVSLQFKDYDFAFARAARTHFFMCQKEFLEAIIKRGMDQNIFLIDDCTNASLFVLCVLKGAVFNELMEAMDLTKSGDMLCRLILAVLKLGKSNEKMYAVSNSLAHGEPADPREH